MGRMQDVSVPGDFLGFKLKGEMVVVFFFTIHHGFHVAHLPFCVS